MTYVPYMKKIQFLRMGASKIGDIIYIRGFDFTSSLKSNYMLLYSSPAQKFLQTEISGWQK